VGIDFEVRPTGVEEETAGDPVAVALANARRKAEAIEAHPPELVLGADTVVALDGEIMGKPRDAAHAREYLERLNGRTHEVIGGIAFKGGAAAHEVTRVTFRRVDSATLDWYVGTGEWEGRAGGYAIQGAGAALVARIEGDYLNVVGLPLARLLKLRPGLMPRPENWAR
jgi:septum formation protein